MKRPFCLGLTGSIGMGKSTTAGMFRDLGIPVWDADEAVSRLYESGGQGALAVAKLVPDAICDGGSVDRTALKEWVASDPENLRRLEWAIHPLVKSDRDGFISHAASDIVVLDIPLLFEIEAEKELDAVLVVTTDPETQKKRVLARPGMTERAFTLLMARQMPDQEKRARADFIVETNTTEDARRAVQNIIGTIRKGLKSA